MAPEQSASLAHARQACVAPSHAGFVPPHWPFTVQPTQVAVATSQTEVAPTQRVPFVAEH